MVSPASRPVRGPKGYRFPEVGAPLRSWQGADASLRDARCYWLSTTNSDQSPHARPVWGVWINGCLYFDGSPKTQWARNLARSPSASIHLESATDVLVATGIAEDLDNTDEALGRAIVAAWTKKYARLAPKPSTDGIFRFVPRVVYAWSEDLHDATMWSIAPVPE